MLYNLSVCLHTYYSTKHDVMQKAELIKNELEKKRSPKSHHVELIIVNIYFAFNNVPSPTLITLDTIPHFISNPLR